MEHLNHIRLVFETLRLHKLFLKKSKCSFGESQVTYLGHIIHRQGVSVGNAKLSTGIDWPRPQTVKSLRGFLVLSGYYCKFVKDCVLLAAPLTNLLNRNQIPVVRMCRRGFLCIETSSSFRHQFYNCPTLS